MLIIEILGRPAEHIVDSLKTIIEKISKENGLNIIEAKVHEANKLENGDLFTSFAEVEAEFNKLENLINVIFSYMPSHVEIIAPEKLDFENSEISNLLTTIMIKIHKYDEIAKKLYVDNSNLQGELNRIVELAKQVKSNSEKIKTVNEKEESPSGKKSGKKPKKR